MTGSLRIGFVLANNFTLSAFSLFVDVLRLAADDGDQSRQLRCRWPVMSAKAEPIRSSCGVLVVPTSPLVPPAELDYVVIVGGLLRSPALDAASRAYLRAAAASGTTLVGLCTGPFLLCREGLMAGRRSCVSWFHYQDFKDEFPDQEVVADRLFLIDRDRITCSGGSNVADLAVHLVKLHVGPAQAQKAQHILQVNRVRAAEDSQPHPPMESDRADKGPADERVRRALLIMEQNLGEPLTMDEVARRVGLSPRQLERRFQHVTGASPTAAYRKLRLRYASWLLNNTALSVTEVAIEAGFADGAHFSRQFRDAYGHPPSQHRPASPRAAARPGRPAINPGLMPPERRQYA
jgi:transcriptional regulator GlxA family with amidase domain